MIWCILKNYGSLVLELHNSSQGTVALFPGIQIIACIPMQLLLWLHSVNDMVYSKKLWLSCTGATQELSGDSDLVSGLGTRLRVQFPIWSHL